MEYLDYFKSEQNATVVINGKDIPTTFSPDGTPIYPDIEKFNGKGWFWLISATERYAFSRLGNESTHWLAIKPSEIIEPIESSDIATINNKNYRMFIGEDILQLGDVNLYTVKRIE